MKLLTKLVAASVIALFSMSASAELIKADWQTDGDGLMVADTESGLNWLSLTETAGQSVAGVIERLSSDLVGWRLATGSEYSALMETTFPEYEGIIVNTWTAITSDEAEKWQSLFGSSNPNGSTGVSEGWYMSAPEEMWLGGKSNLSIYGNYNQSYYSQFYTQGYAPVGVFLVSDTALSLELQANEGGNATSVPLPATSVLLGMGLLAFGARRKKSNDSN